MAIDFPNTPALNDEFSAEGRTWIWNGYAWDSVGTVLEEGPVGPQGPQGIQGPPGSLENLQATSPILYDTETSTLSFDESVLAPATIVSDTPPSTPEANSLWYDSTTGRTYIRYDSSWVETDTSVKGSTGPAGPAGPTGATGPAGADGINAGSNAIINGAFDIWARGTSFTSPLYNTYTADRWRTQNYDNAPTTYSISRETFTPGTAPVAGYESSYFWRSTITTVGTNTIYETCSQRIEDVRTFAGQTVTYSFWAKSDSTRTQKLYLKQNFGTGGSSDVDIIGDGTSTTPSFTTTTSWQRFTFTANAPSMTGKTIGAGSFVYAYIKQASASGSVLDIWGVQLEAGSVATPFKRNAPSIQAELAACQRYYYRVTAGNSYGYCAFGNAYATTAARVSLLSPVTMRTIPTAIDYSGVTLQDGIGGNFTPTSITIAGNISNGQTNFVEVAVSSGLTAFRPMSLGGNNNSGHYIGLSAEL